MSSHITKVKNFNSNKKKQYQQGVSEEDKVVAAEGAHTSIMARLSQKLEKASNAICLATGIEMAAFVVDVRSVDELSRASAVDIGRPSTVNLADLEGEKREKKVREKERRETSKLFFF